MTTPRAAPPLRSSIARPFAALRASYLSSLAGRPSFVVSQAVLWLICCALFLVLWDRWLIEAGPHGPYRWVGMDFAPYWVGTRAMLQGQSPYSLETTLAIQQAVFGGPVRPGEDPMKFVYPATVGILFIPLAVLPLPWAAALWCGSLLWGGLNFLGRLATHLGRASLPRMALWFVLLTASSFPFIVIAVSKGQLVLLSLLTLVAAWRLWRRNEMAAGVLLALAALKPTVVLWPVAGLLLWATRERRWRLWLSFSVASLGLVALSQAMIGNWLPDFLELLQAKGDAPILWSLELAPWPWRGLYVLLFVGLLLWAARIAWQRNDPAPWLTGTLLFGLAVSPMRWIYDLLLAWAVPVMANVPRGWGSALLGLALLSPWGFAWIPLPARWTAMVMGVPLFWAGVWMTLYRPGKG